MMEDRELLKAFALSRSEEAFEILVRRYVDLVYSAALRQARDTHKAQDISQAVFMILARKAASLNPDTILSGWFYRTTRFVTLESMRTENRRKAREARLIEETADESNQGREDVWKNIAPCLDETMELLNDADRNAILLRFFQGKNLGELAAILGVTEEAAKKRVSRALDRLRQKLFQRGITSSSSLLGVMLTAYAIHPAPAVTAGSISFAAAQGVAATSAPNILTEGVLQMIAWSKIKVIGTCGVVLLLATGTATLGIRYKKAAAEHERALKRDAEFQSGLRLAEAGLRAEAAQLESENAALRAPAQEIHGLRNQIAQARRKPLETGPLATSIAQDGAPPENQAAAEILRELQFAHFVVAGQKAMALQPLPEETQQEYAPSINLMKNVGLALRIYATDHGDQFPTSLDLLVSSREITETMKAQLEEGGFEYNIFTNAETKPSLPAVWTRAPDANGVRVLVLTDGSAHLIREPDGVKPPASVATASTP